MIEIVVDGKYIVPYNGSCIQISDDGKLTDIHNADNLAFDPYEGMPELDPMDIIEELPDVPTDE